MMLPPPPIQGTFDDGSGNPSRAWIDWMQSLYLYAKKYRGYGTTADRPLNGLETGDQYFDTTLGKPIFYEGPGWVDATGTGV